MDILLIGGTGIISYEICSLAIQRGHNVSIVNRGRRKEFISDKANLILADIRKESSEDLRKKICIKKYDVIVDFISYNTEHLKKMLNIIEDYCKQYIFISSATVYAEKESHIYCENDAIGNDRWEYCLKKSECERYLTDNRNDFKFEYTIIRPYVTYGKTRFPYQIIPLEYYTIINRILVGKPILICGNDTKCTVTCSKEFAIGAVGLFMNPKAYGEAFHITASKATTWKSIMETIAKKMGCDISFVDIPVDFFMSRKNCGLGINELYGDKSRNMIFDNSKIKTVVPEFKGNIDFEDGIEDTIKYYKEKKISREINYIWDARVDRMILDYSKKNKLKINKKVLNFKSSEKYGIKDKIKYFIGKSNCFYYVSKFMKEHIVK